jgi:hypothetical protein
LFTYINKNGILNLTKQREEVPMKAYYTKNFAHPNKDYFVSYLAIPEKRSFHREISCKRTKRYMETLLQGGKMATWFKAKIVVTIIGTDKSGEVEVESCSYKEFDDFLKDKVGLRRIIKKATAELEAKTMMKSVIFSGPILLAA